MDNLKPSIPIARFDDTITIQAATITADASGGMVETWAAVTSTDWAVIEYPGTGNDEGFTNGAEYEKARMRVTIRYRGDVTVKNRLLYGSDVYDIVNVARQGRNKYEILLCEHRGETA